MPLTSGSYISSASHPARFSIGRGGRRPNRRVSLAAFSMRVFCVRFPRLRRSLFGTAKPSAPSILFAPPWKKLPSFWMTWRALNTTALPCLGHVTAAAAETCHPAMSATVGSAANSAHFHHHTVTLVLLLLFHHHLQPLRNLFITDHCRPRPTS